MREKLAVVFFLLMVISGILWATGFLGFALIPLVTSQEVETVGGVFFGIACFGELATYLFAWLAGRFARSSDRQKFQVQKKDWKDSVLH
jgi:hypothetical protein